MHYRTYICGMQKYAVLQTYQTHTHLLVATAAATGIAIHVTQLPPAAILLGTTSCGRCCSHSQLLLLGRLLLEGSLR